MDESLAEIIKQRVADLVCHEGPLTTHDVQNDRLCVMFEDVPHYAEVLSENVKLYKSMETHQIVGCQLFPISYLMTLG